MRVPRSPLAQLSVISGATMVNEARPIALMVFLIWSIFICVLDGCSFGLLTVYDLFCRYHRNSDIDPSRRYHEND